ncbi:nuclear cap-binding protein subunit 1 [Histomonas meleagridis]|uniref:nuclear cap-binding protein subunit 1 n=1 Tax=Histomonas meleagridis TaxID=135588 RepID=UPI00355A7A97|nr:nuclear cap-binding protein subunit 1 [Histomonas meleagridis]KAH0802016.1 nuclear cap-binding protein subunit 1 [Histomonas meleagridis]
MEEKQEIPAQPLQDEFGREIQHSEEPEPEPVEVQYITPKRHVIDANIELPFSKHYSPENIKIARQIAEKLVRVCNPSSRFGCQEIKQMAGELFNDFSEHTEILFDVFIESAVRMSPQVECLAALVSCYITQFANNLQNDLVTSTIPAKLQEAFTNDYFRVFKLLLRFIGSLAYFKIITTESFDKLLESISDIIPSSSLCRAESISRSLLMAIKMGPVSPDTKEKVIDNIKSYIQRRPPNFILNLSPMKDNNNSFLDTLLNSEELHLLSDSYIELFSNSPITPIDLPEITFNFGEEDLAPLPLVFLRSEHIESGPNPIISDIADDILVFFGNDANLTAAQMIALPMLLNYKSLRFPDNEQSPLIFVVQLFNTVIVSDILKIPTPYYPTCFHVLLYLNLVDFCKNWPFSIIQMYFSPIILQIVSNITKLDTGLYRRLINFFVHFISCFEFSWCWSKWQFFLQLAENDLRFMFLKDIINQLYNISHENSFINDIQEFQSIFPKGRKLNFIYGDEGSDYDLRSKQLRKKLEDTVEVVDKEYKELVGIFGEYEALQFLITNIYNAADGVPDRTINLIEKFSIVIKEAYDADWKVQLLVKATAEFYSDFQPVYQEIMVYMILTKFVTIKSVLNYYFDIKVNPLSNYNNWPSFYVILDTCLAMKVEEKKFDEAKDLLFNIIESACDYFNKMEMTVVAKKFFLGNLAELGRQYYNVLEEIYEKINIMMTEKKAKEEFVELVKSMILAK